MYATESRIDSHRPALLYLYGDAAGIDRAHRFGELRLRPNGVDEPMPWLLSGLSPGLPLSSQILPFGAKKSVASSGFLILSLSTASTEAFAEKVPGNGSCLVIRDTEAFGERLHRAVAKALPQWAGIDAAVSYGAPSPLGAVFTKERRLSAQKEWLFAWRPVQPSLSLRPLMVQIGSLESFTEVLLTKASER